MDRQRSAAVAYFEVHTLPVEMQLVAIMPFLIPIVGILAWAYLRAETIRAESRSQNSELLNELDAELAEAEADRERLRKRIETLEAIVTGEGFDLEREARKAGLDLDALGEAPGTESTSSARRRTR
jgi:phage shock protein B